MCCPRRSLSDKTCRSYINSSAGNAGFHKYPVWCPLNAGAKPRPDFAPRQGRQDGPLCRIEVFEPWVLALDGIERYEFIEVIYWLHLSRRDLVQQSPANDETVRGTFSLRSPVRPNPLGTSIVKCIAIEGASGPQVGLPGRNTIARSET